MPDEAAPESNASTPKPSTRAPKPKPRAGVQRKTKEEREQFAKAEAERQKARAADEGHNDGSRTATRGGKAGRGGRGTAGAGQREEGAKEGSAGGGIAGGAGGNGGVGGGGVFGAGSGLRPGSKRSSAVEGYSEMLDGQQTANLNEQLRQSEDAGRAESSAGGRTGTSKKGDIVDIVTDDEPDEPKRDIERIWISSDGEDDIIVPSKGKQHAKPRVPRVGIGLRPVRAPRTRREVEEEHGMSQKKGRGTKKLELDTQELEDDEGPDAEDHVQFVKEQPSSPELRRRSLKRQSGKATREVKLATTETLEERAERLRVTDDVNKLRHIFGPEQWKRHSGAVEDSKDAMIRPEDGKLFLFQLPPLTPYLVDPSAVEEELEFKQELAGESRANIPTNIPAGSPTEVSKSIPDMKKDADASAQRKPALQMEGLLTASEPRRLPSGLVGKLRLHKSGKVSLDWGGTDMEVRYGSEVTFLQDVVLIQSSVKREDDEAGGEEGNDGASMLGGGGGKKAMGTTYALGQVNSKMVLIPDWAKLYD